MKRIKWDVVLTIITNKELEQVGIEPDMESISGEEISKMFQQATQVLPEFLYVQITTF